MDLLQENLNKLPAKAPIDIIARLIESRVEHLVTLFTRDGFTFSGSCVSAQVHAGEKIIIFRMADPGRNFYSNNIAYIPAAQISHLQVHDADKILKILSYGAIARNPDETAPPRLQLQREMDLKITELSTKTGLNLKFDWEHIPNNATALLNLKDLVQSLLPALASIFSDKMGREAIKKFKSIQIAHSQTSLNVSANSDRIQLSLDLEKALPENLNDDLIRNLNKVL